MKRKVLAIFIIILALIILVANLALKENVVINAKDSKKSAFETINSFQLSRYNEIREAIFGKTSDEMFNDGIENLPVIEGNKYFNWTNTTDLGITPWNGTTNDTEGNPLTWSHFTGGEDNIAALKVESNIYTDSYIDGATGNEVTKSNSINWYVIDIYTAEELRWVLEKVSQDTAGNSYKVNINKDIDLNGKNFNYTSINLTNKANLYIEGNGHIIYNLKNKQQGFFGIVSGTSLIIENLEFDSSMVISTQDIVGVLCGSIQDGASSTGLLFQNVHIKNAFIRGGKYNVGTFIGRMSEVVNRNVFIKNCSSQNSIIVGEAHVGGFCGCQHNVGSNYKVKYDTKFPEVPESFFNDIVYPEMIEDCYSIDCEVFSTKDDSGAFISCGGKFIVRNCFTNNTVYANEKTGVFIGREVGNDSRDNGLYDDNGKKRIDAYFENCYASGIIEGASKIGGFIGFIQTVKDNGVSVFKNCYSTSMVGMEYSGEALGGFIGDDTTPTSNAVTLKVGDETKEFYGSVFINCYAAGEVGNITTNTDNTAENTNTVGGFIGTYTSHKSNMINCYYDKQTTGMRERAMGYRADNSTGQIEGVTGVYTKGSSLENGTAGLTGKTENIVDMQDDNSWVQSDGLYPQLRVFAEATNFDTDKDTVKAYSQASTSTVFLDHWDYIMTSDNQTYNIQTEEAYTPTAKAEENNYIYDTIRDITLKFELTSNENSEHTYSDITWYVDSEMNSSREFVENYTINYGETSVVGEDKFDAPVLTILNPAKDSGNIDPELLQLMKDLGDTKDIYKCYEFAPGKNWVSLEVKNDDGTVTGKRKLRLLPMAYVDAGNYAEIEIDAEGNNVTVYKNSDGKEFSYDGENYNHYLDTIYTTTSKENLGNSDNYQSQEVSKNANTQFAMWGKYPAEQNKLDSTSRFDALYSQSMIGDATEGLTKVEVYKLDVEYVETTLENGQKTQLPKINYDSETRITEDKLDNEKWTGMVNFGAEDAGWYELKYYWRLNDGRYLYDSKIVVIKGEAHNAIIENQIFNKDVETMPEIMPDIKQNEKEPSKLIFDGTDVDETVGITDTITRTKEIQNFSGEEILLGWKNDGNYKLVDLSIEVSQDGTNWTPLVLELNNPENPYDFINAKYTYYYQDYKMLQNPNTKEFYLMAIDEPKEITTVVTPIANGENPDYAKYLYLSFFIKEDDNSIKSVRSDVRVKASFVPMDTHVIANKYVDKENALTGDEVTYTTIMEADYFTDAFDINASDIIPENTEYITNSIEVGEYIEDTNTYIPDTEQKYSSSSYNNETRELSWHYDKMQYGKKYYAKFKVNVTGVVDKLTQDFIKVDNIVNFTYRKSEFGAPVNGEPSKAATFIIIQDERVYLVIDKEITTDNAPLAKFKMNSEIIKENLDLEKYKWYVDYEQISDTSSSVEINQDQVAMLVGKATNEENLDNAYYKISEDLNAMPANYFFSSITDNGEGILEAGKVKKVIVNNYYKAPTDQLNVFIEKRDIETDEYVANAKMKLKKEDTENVYNDYLIWDTKSSHKTIALDEGKYKLLEETAPAEYKLSDEELYFEIVRNDSGNLVLLKDGNEISNKIITFYNERIKYDCTVKYFYNGVEDKTQEEHLNLPKDYVVTEYTDKVKKGYRLMTTEEGKKEGIEGLKDGIVGLPLTVSNIPEQNIISVYYVIDENQTKELSYTVEYYKDGIKVEADTQTEKQAIQVLQPDTLTVDTTKINTLDKYIGYKLEKTVLNDSEQAIPDEVNNGDVIKVYYVIDDAQTKDLSYTVEYYKDGIKVEADTQTESKTVQILQPDTLSVDKTKINTLNKYVGYKLEKTELNTAEQTIPDEVNTGDIIKVYYVIDDAQTKDLSYTVEYYKDGEKVEADTQSESKTVQILQPDTLSVDKTKINTLNKYVGYKLEKTELNTVEQTIPDEVNTGDIIKVYYVIDEAQTKELSYTVEYYKNGVKVEADTQTERKTVQILQPDTLSVDKTKINTLDKYTGYKLEKTVLNDSEQVIPNEVNNGEVIKVYYVIDEDNTKELSYTVEYYKDGEKVESDTQTEKQAVQILQPDILSVDKTKINTLDKYIGYKLEKIELNETEQTIPDEVNNGDVIKVYYIKDQFEYKVEYYYDGVLDESKTETASATYQDVIKNYTDKNITGYKFDKTDNLPLTISEYPALNIIKVYYVKDKFEYIVNYYYDGVQDNSKTETLEADYGDIISAYTDKIKDGYKFEKTENLPLTISENSATNVINVYYVRKDSQVIVKYVDIITKKEIFDDVIKNGKVFDEFDVAEDKKEDDNYTLVETPNPTTGTFTEEVQTKIYYYAKNTEVIVKYLEIDETPEDNTDNKVLKEDVVIKGYIGKKYTTSKKDVPNYTYVESTINTSGTMTEAPITVIYYYIQNTKVIVNHIDKNSGATIDTVEKEGVVGDQYTSKPIEREEYVLVERPEQETVTMKKEVIILNYYYVKVSAGVVEKHIDIMTGELIEDETIYEGNEGDPYTTSSKTLEGYDLVVDKLPENASGTMTTELIEVKYYYSKKTKVITQYIDKATGELIEDETVQSGHAGDAYSTSEKTFAGYDLVKEDYPSNATGTMIEEVEYVKYYYLIKTTVVEKHIDVTTGELLDKERIYTGHEGDVYITVSKEFENYDIVTNIMYYKKYVETNPEILTKNEVATVEELLVKLGLDANAEYVPENATGSMTKEKIEVNYYYIGKAKVVVEYLDKITGEKLQEKDTQTGAEKDSTEIIEGHIGDNYKTEEKVFDKYRIVKENYPTNTEGTMETSENGTIYVKYYYVHESAGVVEKHINIMTGELLETETIYVGYEGDNYTTSSKTFEAYDLVTDKLPENAQGQMTIEQIEVKYYYIRKARVKIEYLEIGTNKKLAEEKIIEGHEGDKYKTESKKINGFNLVEERKPTNAEGKMTAEEIVVKYYYESNVQQVGGSNIERTIDKSEQPKIMSAIPSTGDIIPVIAVSIIVIVIILNLMQLKFPKILVISKGKRAKKASKGKRSK